MFVMGVFMMMLVFVMTCVYVNVDMDVANIIIGTHGHSKYLYYLNLKSQRKPPLFPA